MPWKCPACHDPITHAPFEEQPRRDAVYRCHICRLELVFDPATARLVPAPIEETEEDDETRGYR